MRDDGTVPIGGANGSSTVEADETYHGKVAVPRPRNKYLAPPTKGGKSPQAFANSRTTRIPLHASLHVYKARLTGRAVSLGTKPV